MLAELRIEGLGVIDTAHVLFASGLTAVTGETGAGKTMVLEALQLLLGGRADASMVRFGAVEARVEGRFVDADDEVVVARVIPADGRSRAYVNGRLATVGQLAEIGAAHVELHGQHAHQSLLTTVAQRAALDKFCGTDPSELRDARARITEIDAAIAALGGDARARAREADLLGFQVDELDAAAVEDDDEDRRLSELEDVLADAHAHRQAAATAVDALTADDQGADGALSAALKALSGRRPFELVHGRLRAVAAELADIVGDVRATTDSIDEDPAELDRVRQRRQLLRDVRRKYGETLADVRRFHDEAKARLADIHAHDERVAMWEAQREQAVVVERRAASVVAECRQAGAAALADAVQRHLRTLALPHAVVDVVVAGPAPCDEVTFLLTANPGSAALPLAKVASGGELARAMLAVRLVLTESPDTMVFDEVDAGIGGAAARAVGDALAELAGDRQVLVVTHLAQVAAVADHQLSVVKHTDGTSTATTVHEVDGPDREREIARMLSGDHASDSALQHARDLLATSRPNRR